MGNSPFKTAEDKLCNQISTCSSITLSHRLLVVAWKLCQFTAAVKRRHGEISAECSSYSGHEHWTWQRIRLCTLSECRLCRWIELRITEFGKRFKNKKRVNQKKTQCEIGTGAVSRIRMKRKVTQGKVLSMLKTSIHASSEVRR